MGLHMELDHEICISLDLVHHLLLLVLVSESLSRCFFQSLAVSGHESFIYRIMIMLSTGCVHQKNNRSEDSEPNDTANGSGLEGIVALLTHRILKNR